jgi:hypothetical protein
VVQISFCNFLLLLDFLVLVLKIMNRSVDFSQKNAWKSLVFLELYEAKYSSFSLYKSLQLNNFTSSVLLYHCLAPINDVE